MSLTLDQAHLLAHWRGENTDFPFAPGPYWAELGAEFDRRFREEGIKDVERQWYNQHFSSPPPGYPAIPAWIESLGGSGNSLRELVGLYYKNVVNAHKEIALTNLEPVARSFRYLIDNHWITWDLLISLDTVATVVDCLGGLASWAELGAGWGRIAWVQQKQYPESTYHIFDLPESLLIAHEYLPTYLGCVHLADTPAAPGTYLSLPDKLLRVPDRSIDIMISVASFQEMPVDQCRAYLNLFERKAKAVYLLQRGGINGPRYDVAKRWRLVHHRPVPWSSKYFEAIWDCT